MPPICISVINMKGGVGKTTITALLARHAARNIVRRRQGLDVLAIDLDPQANLSQALMAMFGYDYQDFLGEPYPSIVEVFDGYVPGAPDQSSQSALNQDDMMYNLYGYDHLGFRNFNYSTRRYSSGALQLIPSRFDFADYLVSAAKLNPRRLAEMIEKVFQHKDLILIDCTPTESVFTYAAYHVSDYILVPVRPEFLATIGFPLLQDSLCDFTHGKGGHEVNVLGVVINDTTYTSDGGGPERKRAVEEIKDAAENNGWHVFDNELGFSRGFPKIMRGDNSYSGDSLEMFNRFADEFFDRLETLTP